MPEIKSFYIPIVAESNEAVATSIDNPMYADFAKQYGQVTGLQSYVAPKTFKDKLKMAKEYRKVDIVQRLMRIRVDFGSKIKGYNYPNKGQKKFWDTVFRKVNMRKFIRGFLFDLNTLGVVHPLWELDELGNPLFLIAYDPEKVKTISAFGQEAYFIKPDKQVLEFVKKLTPEQKKHLVIPSYITEAANGRRDEVPVPHDRMVRVSLNKMDYEADPEPPLSSIYDSLALRKLLIETDFSTAYGIKNEIIQVTEGDDKVRTTVKKLQDLENMFKKPGKTLMLFTNHTVNIKRNGPDPKIWAPDKYKAAEERIFQWGGIAKALISGEGGSYATSYISIKSLMQSVQTDREYVEEFFDAFCEQVAKAAGKSSWPSIKWDETALREDKAWQSEQDFLMKWGIYGPRDLCEMFDIDYEKQIAQRKADREQDHEYMIPHFEFAQGLLAPEFGVGGEQGGNDDGTPGRPSEGGRPAKNNEPRPSTS